MFSLFYPASGLQLNKDRPYFVIRSSKKFFLDNNNTSSHAAEEKSAFDLVKTCLFGFVIEGESKLSLIHI